MKAQSKGEMFLVLYENVSFSNTRTNKNRYNCAQGSLAYETKGVEITETILLQKEQLVVKGQTIMTQGDNFLNNKKRGI